MGIAELWRGELQSELQQLRVMQERIHEVEAKLEELAAADDRVGSATNDSGCGTAAGGSDGGAD